MPPTEVPTYTLKDVADAFNADVLKINSQAIRITERATQGVLIDPKTLDADLATARGTFDTAAAVARERTSRLTGYIVREARKGLATERDRVQSPAEEARRASDRAEVAQLVRDAKTANGTVDKDRVASLSERAINLYGLGALSQARVLAQAASQLGDATAGSIVKSIDMDYDLADPARRVFVQAEARAQAAAIEHERAILASQTQVLKLIEDAALAAGRPEVVTASLKVRAETSIAAKMSAAMGAWAVGEEYVEPAGMAKSSERGSTGSTITATRPDGTVR
jgi:hypothetical protein